MTARTLYALPGPLQLTPSQLGLLGRFKLTSRTLATVRAELWTDAGADVVDVTNPGDSVAFPLLGLRAVHLSASSYPAHVLLESTELPIALECAVQIGNTLANPMPVTTGGGGGGGCLFKAPFSLPSPVDLLGGHVGGTGDYIRAASIYPSSVRVLSGSPGSGFYGVANALNGGSGGHFGLGAAVLAAMTITVEWVFVLPGARHVCSSRIVSYGGPFTSTIGLYVDGVEAVAAGAWDGSGNAALSPAALGVEYAFRYSYVHGGGYYPGVDLGGFLLWPLTL